MPQMVYTYNGLLAILAIQRVGPLSDLLLVPGYKIEFGLMPDDKQDKFCYNGSDA